MHELNTVERDLMFSIAGSEKPNGVGLQEMLTEYYETKVSDGRLYSNLENLVEKDLIEKGEVNKRTNYYALTEKGRTLLEERYSWEREYLELPNDLPRAV